MGTYTAKLYGHHVAISREAPQETDGSGWRTGDFKAHVPIDEWGRFRAAVEAADRELSVLLATRRREVDEQLEGLPDASKPKLRAAFEDVPREYWRHLREAINAAREGEA